MNAMQNRRREDLPETEALYGAHPIIEALKAKRRKLISIYTTKPEPKAFDRIRPFLPKHGNFVINYVTRDVLTKICGSPEHMGVVAWMSSFQFQKNFFSPDKHPQILLLDAIQDTRNLGAILRSAHCTNFDAVVLCQSKGAPMNAGASKASAGLAEHLQIFLAASMGQAVDLCKKAGYSLYMSVLDGQDLRLVEVKKPACLVIGNEEKGISKEVAKRGELITLPQKNPLISYNASVAAGILMFQFSFFK
jgi:23S rRNA (guanosine2251-2'-O)-methyltransferase